MSEHAERIIRVVNSQSAGCIIRHALANTCLREQVAVVECIEGDGAPKFTDLCRQSGMLVTIGHAWIERNFPSQLLAAEIAYAENVLRGATP